MREPVFLVLLVTAILGTYLVIRTAARGEFAGASVSNRLGMTISGVMFVLWGVVAMASFEVVNHAGDGSTVTNEYVEIAWLAALGGVIMLYSLFQAALHELNETGGI